MRLALFAPLLLAACAAASPPPAGPLGYSGQATGRIGETVSIHDVAITPIEVIEDSRCPVEVQCVHAGFLRVRVEIRTWREARTETMELNRGLALEDARSLRLTDAAPVRRHGEPPAPGDYRLTFTMGPGD